MSEDQNLYEELESLISEHEDTIYNLEQEISSLEDRIYELEIELEKTKLSFGNTLNDEYKMQFYLEHHDKYTPWEFEELLINGKNYLKK